MARKVSSTQGGFAGPLDDLDGFGAGLEQRRHESPQNDDFFLAGSPGADSGGMDLGSFWEIGIELTRPQASFGGAPTVGTPPLSVSFQSHEQGYVTSWEWDFGDGAVSQEEDPTHVYTALGTYDVSLTVSSIDGTDTETKLGYVVVSTGGFATPYACTTNYNLFHWDGELSVGDTPTFVLYDFEGWFPLGSLTFLGLSVAPDPAFPCGTPAPAFTMSSSPAELLLDFGPGMLLYPILVGTPTFQQGIFSTGFVTVPIPPNPWLEGMRVYAQGLIFDTTPGASQRFGLTSGLEIVIGP